MKSSLFGYNAKIALAVMAICGGLFTSCYEKDDADILPPGAPEYRIAGTITDYLTGNAIASATVVAGGQTYTANASGQIDAAITYTATLNVEVSASGYLPVSRTVTMKEVPDGAIFIVNVSTALMNETVVVPESLEVVSTMSQSEWTSAKTALEGGLLQLSEGTITELNAKSPTAGTVTATNPTVGTVAVPRIPAENRVSFTGYAENPDKVGYVWYNGFEMAGNVAAARAIDPAVATQIFKNGIASKTGYSAGFEQSVGEFTVPSWGTYSVSGYRAEYGFTATKFEGTIQGASYTGIALFQETLTLYPRYFNHDTHDSHDSHDGHDIHGGNPNAGGGSGSY